jgi:hypothetical protein
MRKLFLFAVMLRALILCAPIAHAGERSSLPKEMVGQWCHVNKDGDEFYERRDCRGEGDGTMTIDKHKVFYMEDGCDFTKVQQIDRNVFYVHGDCGGEGMSWKERMIFHLTNDGHIRIFVITHSNEKSEG